MTVADAEARGDHGDIQMKFLDKIAAWWLRRRGWDAYEPIPYSQDWRTYPEGQKIFVSPSDRKPVVVDTKWFYVGDRPKPSVVERWERGNDRR